MIVDMNSIEWLEQRRSMWLAEAKAAHDLGMHLDAQTAERIADDYGRRLDQLREQ